MAAKIDVMKQLDLLHARARTLDEEGDALDAKAATEELVACFDAMLSRWWSNVTDADKALGNRAAEARRRFAGLDRPRLEIDEHLSEDRRAAADRERMRNSRGLA